MDRVPIPRDNRWQNMVEPMPAWGRTEDGFQFIRCQCGYCLSFDHTVDKDGNVTPSLWHDTPECGWHVWARLLDWSE